MGGSHFTFWASSQHILLHFPITPLPPFRGMPESKRFLFYWCLPLRKNCEMCGKYFTKTTVLKIQNIQKQMNTNVIKCKSSFDFRLSWVMVWISQYLPSLDCIALFTALKVPAGSLMNWVGWRYCKYLGWDFAKVCKHTQTHTIYMKCSAALLEWTHSMWGFKNTK